MIKSLRTLSCMAVLGATLAIAVPAHANDGTMTDGKKHHHMMMKEGKAFHDKMQANLDALASDHAKMKAGDTSPALMSKLDQDLSQLEANRMEMKGMHEKMKAMHANGDRPMMQHDMMGGKPMSPMAKDAADSAADAPSDVQHEENSRGNWPNTDMPENK